MANHMRQQIREAMATAVTSLTTTSTRVYQSSVYPLEDANLPGLLVYSDSETVSVLTMHGHPALERKVLLRVVGVAKAVADLDDTLDLIAKEVEIAAANAVSALATLKTTLVFTGTQIEMQGTAERPVGTVTLNYEATYFTADNAPDVAL